MPYKDPARAKAQRRNRDHIRRSAVSDVTAQDELDMRRRARRCPLCNVGLSDTPNLPASKHLDHIVPLGVGGTHTHGNVRITCARCNVRRPRDGSDFTGQITLWAQGEVVIARPSRQACRKGLHPWVPANIVTNGQGRKRCRACRVAAGRLRDLRQCRCGAMFAASGKTFMCAPCIEASARRAAELHASGLSWTQAAARVGYTTDEGARYAAKRVGYTPAPRPKTERSRGCPECGTPMRKGARNCQACTEVLAWRAVEMRRGGQTLQQIADRLGYRSISAVTNLMKTVATVGNRLGRPPASHTESPPSRSRRATSPAQLRR